MRLLRKIVLLLIVMLLAVACYPDVDSPQRPTVNPNPTPGVQDDPNVVPDDDTDAEETEAVDDDQTGDTETGDTDTGETDEDTGDASNIAVPLEESDLENVTAQVTDLQVHLADEGTQRLELILTFVNNSNEEVTLDYVTESYRLRDSSGTEIAPTAMTSILSNPEIPANESVSGELEFPTLDAATTYTLILPDFEDIVIDASGEFETLGEGQFP